jgi:hypothetical protein
MEKFVPVGALKSPTVTNNSPSANPLITKSPGSWLAVLLANWAAAGAVTEGPPVAITEGVIKNNGARRANTPNTPIVLLL